MRKNELTRAKRKKKKRKEERTTEEQWRRMKKIKKKKGQKLRLTLTNGSLHMYLITKMPLETQLWKLKIPKMCFQFL